MADLSEKPAARGRGGRAAGMPGPSGSTRAASGRADGEASRERLVEAARRLFALRGFDGVSIREIAQAARVNLAAIAYHYGGKKGLYRAVLQRLIDDTGRHIGPTIVQLRREVASAGTDRARLGAIAARMVEGLLRAVLSEEENLRWSMALMLREFQQPSDDFPMVMEARIHPMHDAVSALVAAATGRAEDDPETRLVTVTIISQCMAFGAGRRIVWARLGWDGYTPERVERIIAIVTANVLAILDLPRPRPASDGGGGRGREAAGGGAGP